MRRRRVLAAIAVTGGSLLAGCNNGGSSAPSTGGTESGASAASATGIANGSACPPVDGDVVCGDGGDRAVDLTASTSTVSLAGETIGFTLSNRSDRRVSFRPYGWTIWREGEEWTELEAPDTTTDDSDRSTDDETVLSPGGSYAWQVAVGPMTVTADRPPVTINGLEFEPGRHAFTMAAGVDQERTYVVSFEVVE